jgi:hypothetical protein
MMSRPLTLLAVFAHPDDESFAAGGTLAKYAAEGVEVAIVLATRGGAGIRGLDAALHLFGENNPKKAALAIVPHFPTPSTRTRKAPTALSLTSAPCVWPAWTSAPRA